MGLEEDCCDGSCSCMDTFVDKYLTTEEINKQLNESLKGNTSEKFIKYIQNVYSFFKSIIDYFKPK